MTHLEIVSKLIGPITPTGKTEVDQQRMENLKAWCSLVEEMVNALKYVAFSYKDSYAHSEQEIGQYAATFLKNEIADLELV